MFEQIPSLNDSVSNGNISSCTLGWYKSFPLESTTFFFLISRTNLAVSLFLISLSSSEKHTKSNDVGTRGVGRGTPQLRYSLTERGLFIRAKNFALELRIAVLYWTSQNRIKTMNNDKANCFYFLDFRKFQNKKVYLEFYVNVNKLTSISWKVVRRILTTGYSCLANREAILTSALFLIFCFDGFGAIFQTNNPKS